MSYCLSTKALVVMITGYDPLVLLFSNYGSQRLYPILQVGGNDDSGRTKKLPIANKMNQEKIKNKKRGLEKFFEEKRCTLSFVIVP